MKTKKTFPQLSLFIPVVALLLYTGNANAQKNSALQGWTTSNPFKTDVFIENYGQFDNWVKTESPVKYAVNSSDKIFFTQQGLIFKLEKTEEINEEEYNEIQNAKFKMQNEKYEEEEFQYKMKTYYVNMTWEGCNADAVMEVSESTEGYYTFGEKGYENIKAKGYKKLHYYPTKIHN